MAPLKPSRVSEEGDPAEGDDVPGASALVMRRGDVGDLRTNRRLLGMRRNPSRS